MSSPQFDLDSPASSPASPSPAPAGKKHAHSMTSAELQKRQLDKLLKRVDRPMVIPDTPKSKEIKPPKDIVRNVQGSSAGAGSGEFHVYRAHRRREYARLKMLDENAKKSEEQMEYEAKIAEMKAVAEARTAKKRAKRQKKRSKVAVKKQKTLQDEGSDKEGSDKEESDKEESDKEGDKEEGDKEEGDKEDKDEGEE
ncbi:hypothetical protein BC937DRAFT_87997 [Endogone sp. FLAS-F59071]|nr:hypothetical protein BC937DRAFT_87997 [Endogone sp. FLAS-F59071]|eukprot:RUS19097.1 hypothetical protein BC937DRAFT_87997 [Endogone sp. FLAS-F59071]